jgi:hypothetical protein
MPQQFKKNRIKKSFNSDEKKNCKNCDQFFGQKLCDEAGFRTHDLSSNSQARNLLRHWGQFLKKP